MLRTLTTATIVSAFALAGPAMSLTQTQVVGTSPNPNYPVEIVASDGNTYFCKADLQRDGKQAVRVCLVERDGLGAGIVGLGALGGAGGAGAVAVGVLAAGALAVALTSDDDDDSSTATTTTTTANGD